MVAQDAIQAMREAVFRTPEGQKTRGGTTTIVNPLVGKVKVRTLSGEHETNLGTLRAFHLYLIAAGASPTNDRKEWQSYTVTLACLCLPEVKASVLASPVFEEHVLSPSETQSLINWADNMYIANDATTEADLRTACKEDAGEAPDLNLPLPKVVDTAVIDEVLSTEGIYGHFSLALFLASKTITDENRPAITVNRPRAIERKYFAGKTVASLSGVLSLSHSAHAQIHAAFVSLSALRRHVFERVARFNLDQDSPHVSVMATTTRLMRFAGMQQAVLIDQFLSSHEEAFRVPMLAPSIAAYAASLRDLERVPSELRPFYKVINGDETRVFNRNDISNLLVVALNDARELNPSLQRYNIPANHELVMAKYIQSLEALEEDDE